MDISIEMLGSSVSAQDILRHVVVRPILASERARWDGLMDKHHYLGFGHLIGEGLRYVVIFKDQWLALLGWASAALHCGARDTKIGWTSILRQQRLPLIANNVRFLILPNIRIPHLASRILALNTKRLSSDWQARFNHPIILVETFVDPKRFAGTCYLAAGWQFLGETRGFAKSAKRYVHHGQPKTVWIKPLRRDAYHLLTAPVLPFLVRCPMQYTTPFSQKALDELKTILLQLPDVRRARGKRHQLLPVISMSLCAIISGACSFAAIAEWAGRCTQNQLKRFRSRYDYTKKIFIPPSEPTIRRCIQQCDPDVIDQMLGDWITRTLGKNDSPIALDGKVLKGAIGADGTKLQLLSAFLHEQGVVVAQAEVGLKKKEFDDIALLNTNDDPKKTNEIPVARELLISLDIEGRIITADAMHTQRETARLIVEDKKADYVFTVKDNQKTVKEDIVDLHLEKLLTHAETITKGHGRIDIRRIQVSEALNDYLQFPHVKQVFRIERERIIVKTGKTSIEAVVGVSSRSIEELPPDELLKVNRDHWRIEDSLHYVRDKVYDEDRSQVRKHNGPRVMASLRNFSISILHLMKVKNIAKALRDLAAKPHFCLAILGI